MVTIEKRLGRYERMVRFDVVVAEEARQVALAGSFNGWDPSTHPMKRNGGGQWECTVYLAPGQYEYCFQVDGVRWLHGADAAALGPAGSANSVVAVS